MTKNRLILAASAVAFGLALAAGGCAPKPAEAPAPVAAAPSETEINREVVTKFFDLFYVQKKPREAFETYVVPDYIQHNPIAADGRDSAVAALEPFMAGAKDATWEIKRIIVDGDLAAVHVHSKMNPKDRGSAVIDIVRLKDGKIVEHWDVIQPVPEKSANAHPMF